MRTDVDDQREKEIDRTAAGAVYLTAKGHCLPQVSWQFCQQRRMGSAGQRCAGLQQQAMRHRGALSHTHRLLAHSNTSAAAAHALAAALRLEAKHRASTLLLPGNLQAHLAIQPQQSNAKSKGAAQSRSLAVLHTFFLSGRMSSIYIHTRAPDQSNPTRHGRSCKERPSENSWSRTAHQERQERGRALLLGLPANARSPAEWSVQ